MCKRTIIVGVVMSVIGLVPACAQWSLDECIKYALEHNIQLQKQRNEIEKAKINVETARNQRLPDLNASAAENLSFGRGLTSENTYTNKSTYSTALSLNTSVPLFTGMRIPNEVKMQKLNLQAAMADAEKAADDVALNVAQYFFQAVYGIELAEIAQRQVEIDSMQCRRLEALMECGKASGAELSQQEATLAQSRLTATQAANDYKTALLNLSQLLELPTPEGMRIVKPYVGEDIILQRIPTPEEIFGISLLSRSEINAAKLRIGSAERNIAIARSAFFPQLNINGSIGSNYYKTAGEYTDGFAKQMKNRFYQGIGVNLSIPLFNRLNTRNNVRLAKIEHSNRLLDLDERKKALYKEIQQVYYNTVAAESKYRSALASKKSCHDAFTLTKEKYENGKANITEFNEAKNALLKAESEMMRAKYEYLYQTRLIAFYNGEGLSME